MGREEGALDVAVDELDDVYVAGYTQPTELQYPDDYLTMKLDRDTGEVIWQFTLDRDQSTDEAWALAVHAPDDVFVTGRSHTWDTWYDIATVNYADPQGVVGRSAPALPAALFLKAYPNPFNPVTQLRFRLDRTGPVELRVYDLRGRVVAEPVSGVLEAGEHRVPFDGSALSSGVYYARLRTEHASSAARLVLIK
jgi:hypothetical protein